MQRKSLLGSVHIRTRYTQSSISARAERKFHRNQNKCKTKKANGERHSLSTVAVQQLLYEVLRLFGDPPVKRHASLRA